MDIFFTLLFGIVYNWVLLLFFVIALIFRKRRMGIFIVGVIVQGISVFGNVAGMVRNPELWMTTDNIFSIICFVVLAIGGYFFMDYVLKDPGEKETESTEKVNHKIDKEKDFIYFENAETISESAEIYYQDVVIKLDTQEVLTE